MDSLIDLIQETDTCLAVITETWLQDGVILEQQKQVLLLGAGLNMICRNRPPDESNGVSYGGVALVWKEQLGAFSRIRVDGDEDHEILVCGGSLRGYRRKFVVVACYVPPNISAAEAEKCMECVANAVLYLKRKYSSPFLVVAGDFNQWKVQDHLDEFVDIREVDVGPTRGRRLID